MTQENKLVIFQDSKIRRIWHNEEWYFSVVDVVAVLTESKDSKDYWYRLKKRELEQGIELSTNCRQLKLPSSDGKSYLTDCANTKSLLRIIQSIPSKKAEPFKQWLAQVGYERIEEIENPRLGQDRIKEYYFSFNFNSNLSKYSSLSLFISFIIGMSSPFSSRMSSLSPTHVIQTSWSVLFI